MFRIIHGIIFIFFLILLLRITIVAIKFLLFIGIVVLIYNFIRKK
ncbi:hypothetical protein [Clostridium pasteurianum]|nr:hypothetical protein [Clostridium pasteurianum]